MRIPEIRDRLRKLGDRLLCAELHDLADELGRRPPKKRAEVKSEPMTPSLAALIRARASSRPSDSHVELARFFNVNPGRISEALNGKRT